MKHIELVAELMASVHAGHPINKKTSLDQIIGSDSFDRRSLPRVVSETVRTLNHVKKMFPRLRETRLANSVEFYSLFLDLDARQESRRAGG